MACTAKSSCNKATLQTSGGSDLIAQCFAEDSCKESTIDCQSRFCDIQCTEKSSCSDSFMDGTPARGMIVQCGDQANPDSEDACKSSEIICATAGIVAYCILV